MNATDETYNGWKNRETWAFCLHLGNDQGLHQMVLAETIIALDEHHASMAASGIEANEHSQRYAVGEHLVGRLQDMIGEGVFSQDDERSMTSDIGSFWRIDASEVGAWAIESLDEQP